MAIDGESIFSDVANAIYSWEYGSPFATGVNIARLVNIAIQSSEARRFASGELAPTPSFAAAAAAAANATATTSRDVGIIRAPGGVWRTCDMVPTDRKSLCRRYAM